MWLNGEPGISRHKYVNGKLFADFDVNNRFLSPCRFFKTLCTL